MTGVQITTTQGPAVETSGSAATGDLRDAGGGQAARKDAETESSGSRVAWEVRLMHRLVGDFKSYLTDIVIDSKVLPEFLAALTANESGGDPHATRFEPGVYQHLKNVAEGRATNYGSVGKSLLYKEIQRESATGPTDTAHAVATVTQADEHHLPSPASAPAPPARAESYHADHLNAAFATVSAPALSVLEDAAIRRLATSWGLTQIMGYHMLGRPEPVEKLCDPAFHYRMAVQMIEEFAVRFHLDPQRDFEALFRCWNTGRPDGKTFDPAYAEKGMRRIEICRQLLAGSPSEGQRA